MEGLRLKNEVLFQSLTKLPSKAVFEVIDLATRNFCNELSQDDIVNSFRAIKEQAKMAGEHSVENLLPSLERFNQILLIAEFMVSLIQGAKPDDQETYKSVLCSEEEGFTTALFDKILEDLADSSRKMRERRWELLDIKYQLVSLAQVDTTSTSLVLVNLQLAYADEYGKKCHRNLVMTVEEFSQFNSSFMDMCDNL